MPDKFHLMPRVFSRRLETLVSTVILLQLVPIHLFGMPIMIAEFPTQQSEIFRFQDHLWSKPTKIAPVVSL
jgi:hypothetical protein